DDFGRRELAVGLRQSRFLHRWHLVRSWSHEEQSENADHDALPDAEIEEGRLKSLIAGHRLDRHDCECRAHAESGSPEARPKAAPVREPFERISDTGPMDGRG